MTVMPSLFLSHGAPTILLSDGPARRFWQGLAATLPKPRAVLSVSAHWQGPVPIASLAETPATIHDFGGFPESLYRLSYKAPGAPALAAKTIGLLKAGNIEAAAHPDRGFDHGTWIPLSMIYPAADIPVLSLSLIGSGDAAAHLAMGRALAPLREEGVLILGSGSLTHSLRHAFAHAEDDPPPPWVRPFQDWAEQAVAEGRTDRLLAWRETAPFADRHHPTPEHLMPFFVALGAGQEQIRGRLLHQSVTHAVIAMDIYAFD